MSSRADESERLYDILRALGLKPSTDDSRDRIPGAEIDICRAAPYPRENDTVFLAVSVGSAPPKTAAEERRALALGCAWLDTRTLDGLPPGSKGASWIAKAESYAYAVAGRQCEAEARGLTADWEHRARQGGAPAMRYDLDEDTLSREALERETRQGLDSMPGIVDAFNLVDFYNTLKREGDLHHAPLDGMYGTMGLSIAHTLDVKERAYRMLAATIAISLEAAAASTSVAPPAARSRIDFAGPIAPRVRSEAWDIPLPVSSLDLELQRSLPADYDDSSFTKDDQSTTICDGTQVIRRPVRIEHRVARYSEMSDHLANWLITYAQQHAYPNLSTIVSRRKHCRGRRISIKAPVGQNYELLARNLVSHLAIPDSVSQYIDEIVQLRTFVSTWYESMQRSDPSSETSEVARSTERHRAFVGVLENLRLFLCGS
ncbi:hypothetical protein LTR82_008747 [Friedmanniomyces endolithicus]|uniref:DUF6604 domain-containing protein n=1 Tax=Friedmanniomyces endolithicus TaxID=329885 RepID=A0AAN6FKR2_9PEZI|nr:hypothetical protein LTR82_008747 [Friedmanniomyces endolithicus]